MINKKRLKITKIIAESLECLEELPIVQVLITGGQQKSKTLKTSKIQLKILFSSIITKNV